MKLAIDNRRIDKPRIFFSIHPGDPKDHHPVYNFMAKDHRIRPEVITSEIMSGTEMVYGMDMIIQSMSTIGKQAACQRIPVIEFVTDLAMKHHEAVSGPSWWLSDCGASSMVREDVVLFASEIFNFVEDRTMVRKMQKAAQEKMLPRPERCGVGVETMRKTVLEFLS